MTGSTNPLEGRLVAAVELGWRVAELYALVDDTGEPSSDTLLPTHSSLGPADQVELQLRAAAGDAPGRGRLQERALRDLHVELREDPGGTLVDEGQLRPDARWTGPLPLPIVVDAPSLRRRLAPAASFERVVAAELLGRPSAGSEAAPQAGER